LTNYANPILNWLIVSAVSAKSLLYRWATLDSWKGGGWLETLCHTLQGEWDVKKSPLGQNY